jgi:hypothetical protein
MNSDLLLASIGPVQFPATTSAPLTNSRSTEPS